jgi:hypothetical protein
LLRKKNISIKLSKAKKSYRQTRRTRAPNPQPATA